MIKIKGKLSMELGKMMMKMMERTRKYKRDIIYMKEIRSSR
jgi:hypothetical protein